MNALVSVLVLALAAPALATGIPKWRTPDGTLHFGDNPPAGSVLVERIAGVERDPEPLDSERERLREAREKAAADGREIIRRRADQREAERRRDAAEARRAEVANERRTVDDRDVVVVTPGHRHFHPPWWHTGRRFDPPIGFERPKPVRKPFHRFEWDRPKPHRKSTRFDRGRHPASRSFESKAPTFRFHGGRLSVAP